MDNTDKKPHILRTRFIPFETIDISGDEIIFRNDKLLVTKWKAIKPRSDISGGISCAYLSQGFKVGKFFRPDGSFAYWYCDIIDVKYEKSTDTYEFIDLLLDIKLFPDGTLEILDADELAEALEKGLVNMEQACRALRKLDELLTMIKKHEFPPEDCLCHCEGGVV